MGFSSPLIPFQENENISEKETKKDYIFSIILCVGLTLARLLIIPLLSWTGKKKNQQKAHKPR